MKKAFTLLMVSLLANVCCGQGHIMSRVDSISKYKAAVVTDKLLKSVIQNDDHLLFSIDDILYLVVVRDGRSFNEYYLEIDQKESVVKQVIKKVRTDKTLRKAFHENLYQKEYISF